jgi:small conductance mechanosensitive channel
MDPGAGVQRAVHADETDPKWNHRHLAGVGCRQLLTLGIPAIRVLFLSLLTIPIVSLTCFSQKLDASYGNIVGNDSTSLEMLIMIKQALERDRVKLYELRNDSSKLEPLFQKNSELFVRLDMQLDTVVQADSAPEQLEILQIERESAKRKIDLLLEYRRSINQGIGIIERKILSMEEAADLVAKGENATITAIGLQKDLADEPNPAPEIIRNYDSANAGPNNLEEYSWQIVKAKRELALLKARFDYTKKGWLLIDQLHNQNEDHLTVARALFATGNNQLTQLSAEVEMLSAKLDSLDDADSTHSFREYLQGKLQGTQEFATTIRSSLASDSAQIAYLESRIERLAGFQQEMTSYMSEVARQIESQNQKLEFLRSPIAPNNLYSFLINRGPRIVLGAVFLVLIWILARWLVYRILTYTIKTKASEERAERVDTLNRAIRSGLTVVFTIFGAMALLSEFGIDISVLLGGAAVFSIAIAFGAQSLVKDYFSGFMILSENQYRVGNVVKINGISGMVEDISLRTTILRDLQGAAHFIPHGEITIVSNLTHLWSRVELNIGIAYKENVDQVMDVIMETAKKMREEPEYKWLITDDPEMLGVDDFADSAVVIKALVKTRPLKQWQVKRELLRRLKNRFDELGIEIPFPHRTVYHRDLTFVNPESEKLNQTQGNEGSELP